MNARTHVTMLSTLYMCTLLVVRCTSSKAHNTIRTRQTTRKLELFDSDSLSIRSGDISTAACSRALSTSLSDELAAAYGIVFAIESASTDTVGPTVTSLGFHVESNLMSGNNFQFEVYALNSEGYYADKERSDNPLDELSFDYRGDLEEWTLVSTGVFKMQDLQVSNVTSSDRPDYVEIPAETFTKTTVPPNGGQRSFYLTLTSTGMVSADPGELSVNDVAALDEEQGTNSPKILIGESAISYPFSDTTYLYAKRAFVGTVFFESECPTESPSVAPSFAPTLQSASPSDAPSLSPSMNPTVTPTHAPTSTPSMMPSIDFSDKPSSSPTLVGEEVKSGLLLTLNLPPCKFDDNGDPIEMNDEEQAIVSETVKANAEADAAKNGIDKLGVDIFGLNTACERRRLTSGGGGEASPSHRRLPDGTSAVEFSMIITGAFREPEPGTQTAATATELDLGGIAEDSINRDQEKFIRDLADRAPPDSDLNEVQSLEVQAVELPPDGELVAFTKPPTQQATQPPVPLVILEDERSTKDNILLVLIVVIIGLIIILSAFLFFRLSSKRIVRKQNLKAKRMQKDNDRRQELKDRRRVWAGTRNLDIPNGYMDDGSFQSGTDQIYMDQYPSCQIGQIDRSFHSRATSTSSASGMAPEIQDEIILRAMYAEMQSQCQQQLQRQGSSVRVAALRSGGVIPGIYEHPLQQRGGTMNTAPYRGSRRYASFTAPVQNYRYEFDGRNDDISHQSRQQMMPLMHRQASM